MSGVSRPLAGSSAYPCALMHAARALALAPVTSGASQGVSWSRAPRQPERPGRPQAPWRASERDAPARHTPRGCRDGRAHDAWPPGPPRRPGPSAGGDPGVGHPSPSWPKWQPLRPCSPGPGEATPRRRRGRLCAGHPLPPRPLGAAQALQHQRAATCQDGDVMRPAHPWPLRAWGEGIALRHHGCPLSVPRVAADWLPPCM